MLKNLKLTGGSVIGAGKSDRMVCLIWRFRR